MKLFLAALMLISCVACSSMQVSNYIKADNPYTRKIDANFERVQEALKTVLSRHGFSILQEEDPSVYERNEYTERVNKEKAVLIFTNIKKQSGIVDAVFVHLNVYLYQIGEWTDVDLRYEAAKSRVKKFYTYRNDKLMKQLLDEIEKEL